LDEPLDDDDDDDDDDEAIAAADEPRDCDTAVQQQRSGSEMRAVDTIAQWQGQDLQVRGWAQVTFFFSGFFLVFLFRLCVAWDLEIEFECECDCLTERKERKEKASLTSAGDELGFSDRTLACSLQ